MAEGDYNVRKEDDPVREPGGRRSIFISNIAWGAVFAGTLVAVVVQLVLSLLGLSIGAATITPTEPGDTFAGIGTGAAIWWIITALISLFTGGWVAGRLAAITDSFEGMMHGIMVWCLATFLGFLMITTTVGQIMGGAFGVVGQGLAAAGQAAPEVIETFADERQNGEEGALEGIMAEMRDLIRNNDIAQQREQQQQEPGGPNPQQQQPQQQQQQTEQELSQLVTDFLREEEDVDRRQVVDALAENTGMSRQEADQTVDSWVSKYQEAREGIDTDEIRQEAAEVGEDVAQTVATAALWSFIALVLGAAVSGFGGSMASTVSERNGDRHRGSGPGAGGTRGGAGIRTGSEKGSGMRSDDPTARGSSVRERNKPRMPGDPDPQDPRNPSGRNI